MNWDAETAQAHLILHGWQPVIASYTTHPMVLGITDGVEVIALCGNPGAWVFDRHPAGLIVSARILGWGRFNPAEIIAFARAVCRPARGAYD